ncbi:hypothetical protein MNBD_NITROSPINAE01-742 [hydrothermal vent metagenome]|uniref:Response regulatory domain-containing protein n=1 Tax=hydrothermal vent metagenome TaxID=652676 RepID=A0A3B1C0B7_9ZZZZ
MKTILVIDDDELTLEVLKKALAGNGYEVLTANNGKEGIAAYNERRTDLIITDLLMPETSGLGVIEQLKRDFPSAKIFAITAGTSETGNDFLKMSSFLGAGRTFRKPLDHDSLLKAVNEEIG